MSAHTRSGEGVEAVAIVDYVSSPTAETVLTGRYRPDPVHHTLGEAFYDVATPARFPEQILRWRDQRAAREVGLDTLTPAEWLDAFAAFKPLQGNFDEPLALRYHGHQFMS